MFLNCKTQIVTFQSNWKFALS